MQGFDGWQLERLEVGKEGENDVILLQLKPHLKI